MKVLSQCPFWLKEVSLLGHILSAKGVVVDPSKVQEVLEWKSPISITEIPSFLCQQDITVDLPRRLLQSFEAHKPQMVIKLNNYHDTNEVGDTNREVLTMFKLWKEEKDFRRPKSK